MEDHLERALIEKAENEILCSYSGYSLIRDPSITSFNEDGRIATVFICLKKDIHNDFEQPLEKRLRFKWIDSGASWAYLNSDG